MTGFGASAPVGALLKHFGFTVENVVAQAKDSAGPIASCRPRRAARTGGAKD